jgi:hypothetical protein
VTIALGRWCELAQHNNLLSIVPHALIPALQYERKPPGTRGPKQICAEIHADQASYRWRSGWVVERFGTGVGVLYGSKKPEKIVFRSVVTGWPFLSSENS